MVKVQLELGEKDTGVFLYDPYELCDQFDLINPCCCPQLTPIVIGQIIEATQRSMCVHARLLYRIRTQKCINPFWSFWHILWPIALIFKRSFLLLEVFQDSDSATEADPIAHLWGHSCTDSGCKGCYQAKMTETVQEKAHSSVKYLKEQWSCDAWNPSCIDLGVKASSSFIQQQQQHPGRSNIERLMEWLQPFIPT